MFSALCVAVKQPFILAHHGGDPTYHCKVSLLIQFVQSRKQSESVHFVCSKGISLVFPETTQRTFNTEVVCFSLLIKTIYGHSAHMPVGK